MQASFDGIARANGWIAHMQAYKGGNTQEWPLRGEVEREKERYVAGEITLEAFEARLNIAFGLSR